MAPDLRLQQVPPFLMARQAALTRWRARSLGDRLAWAVQPEFDAPDDAVAPEIDWSRLLQFEDALSKAVRAGQPWETLFPEDWDAQDTFWDAFPGLPDNELNTLAAAARIWLQSTPHQDWLRTLRSEHHQREFTPLSLPQPKTLHQLWTRLHGSPAELTAMSLAALAVLAHVDRAAYLEMLCGLPPVLLWIVADRDDPELLLSLAHAAPVMAASYGSWHYWLQLRALENYGNDAAQHLHPLHSTPVDVGAALTLRQAIRAEVQERAGVLVDRLGGGDQRLTLLLRLMEGATAAAGHRAGLFLAEAAARALDQGLMADPAAADQIQGTLADAGRDGPLAAASLALFAEAPEDRARWRWIVLDHLTRRLTLPAEGDPERLGPGTVNAETSMLMYGGQVLAAWLEEEPEAVTVWLTERFAALPIRATRLEPRTWLFGPRAAFLWTLGAEVLARSQGQQPALTALLVRELETRTPEWEWSNSLGERPLDEWQRTAVLTSRRVLSLEERERVVNASRSLWVMVQLLDRPQLALREPLLAARLETDLPAVAVPVLSELEARFAELRRWRELAACRDRRQMLVGSPRPGTGLDPLGPTLDLLAESGWKPENLAWQAHLLRDSYRYGAVQAYTLLAQVLHEQSGAPAWGHAVADVEEWARLVLERPWG